MRTSIILSAIAAVVLSAAASFSANAAQTDNDPAVVESSGEVTTLVNLKSKANPFLTDVWEFIFKDGNTYNITVKGDGGTDLDLYIYDDRGNLVGSDKADGDYCFCRVKASRWATYKVQVKNCGFFQNQYELTITY